MGNSLAAVKAGVRLGSFLEIRSWDRAVLCPASWGTYPSMDAFAVSIGHSPHRIIGDTVILAGVVHYWNGEEWLVDDDA